MNINFSTVRQSTSKIWVRIQQTLKFKVLGSEKPHLLNNREIIILMLPMNINTASGKKAIYANVEAGKISAKK